MITPNYIPGPTFPSLPCLTSNEQALSTITPPPTVLRQRWIAAVRLRAMQRELAAESINRVITREVEVVRGQV
jgi:hypothetical protein